VGFAGDQEPVLLDSAVEHLGIHLPNPRPSSSCSSNPRIGLDAPKLLDLARQSLVPE
jgi:hypothetical protein